MSGQSRWNVANPLFEEVDSILVHGVHGPTPQLDEWGSAASASLSHADPSAILQISYDLIHDMPYDVVVHALNENDGSEHRLGELRKTRKLLLVARDGVQTTTYDNPDESFDDFAGLCWTLGQVADVGTDDVLTHSALAACEKLASHPPRPSQACAGWEFHELVGVMLKLTEADTADFVDADRFHTGRKRLRKLVHTTVINAVIQPTAELRKLAFDGIALSQHYGRIKDELFRQAYTTM